MPGHPDINNNIQRRCAANESLGPECTCVFRTRTSNLICLLSIMKLGLIMTKRVPYSGSPNAEWLFIVLLTTPIPFLLFLSLASLAV